MTPLIVLCLHRSTLQNRVHDYGFLLLLQARKVIVEYSNPLSTCRKFACGSNIYFGDAYYARESSADTRPSS
jgi:hypothetical protein